MKRITLAGALLAASLTAQADELYDAKRDLCNTVGSLMVAVAGARDSGIPASTALSRISASMGVGNDVSDVVFNTALLVYTAGISQDAAQGFGYHTCMMELGNGF